MKNNAFFALIALSMTPLATSASAADLVYGAAPDLTVSSAEPADCSNCPALAQSNAPAFDPLAPAGDDIVAGGRLTDVTASSTDATIESPRFGVDVLDGPESKFLSSWTIMILGVGSIGGTMRMRARKGHLAAD